MEVLMWLKPLIIEFLFMEQCVMIEQRQNMKKKRKHGGRVIRSMQQGPEGPHNCGTPPCVWSNSNVFKIGKSVEIKAHVNLFRKSAQSKSPFNSI